MPPPYPSSAFEGARLKLQRAEKHFTEFKEAAQKYLASEPYGVRYDRGPVETIVRLHIKMPIPADLGLVIGDTLHNLRAVLDFIAYECATLNGLPADQAKRVYFPIFDDLKKLEEALKGCTWLTSDEVDHIRALKPYVGGNAALWELHQFDIFDKHRHILPTASYVRNNFPKLYLNPEIEGNQAVEMKLGEANIFPATDGEILVTFPSSQPNSTVRPTGKVDIVFGPGQVVDGCSVVAKLAEYGNVVAQVLRGYENQRVPKPPKDQ